MNRILLFSSAAWLITSIAPATAAVFERDWKTPGDGLLTFDDVNQREWLDLSVSRLDQFSEPRLENAIAELSPGGLFDGFTWAKRDDVRAFAESAGIDVSTTNILVNEVPTVEIVRLLGPTLESMHGLRSIAFTNESQDRYPLLPPYDGAAFLVNYGGFAGVFLTLNDDELRVANGLMLYRVVPEPSSVYLALGGICGLIYLLSRRLLVCVR